MRRFDGADVQRALTAVRPYVRLTPLEESFYLNRDGRRYFFKLECLQRARSFKIRGAVNKMLSLTEAQRTAGVGTVSSGNHGSSVAYAAQMLGIANAAVIVPEPTPQSKVDKIEYFGGRALRMGRDYDEAHALGMAYIAEHGLTYIDAYYDDPLIYAGQGTVALEILRQNPEIDTIVVPVGGGGLITGIAVAAKSVKPDVRIVGVQTEACPAMVRSYADGVCYEEYPSAPSLCDALLGGIGRLSYEMAKDYVDDLLTVSEPDIARAVSFMARQEKFIAEAGSCTTVAAVQHCAERIGGKQVALVISGGNIDGDVLARVLAENP
ncbi:MAG: threonine/serine dehydratase [Clostridia bacterium]|nr:threonine/serine dehydratase [Clostridia bacterium]